MTMASGAPTIVLSGQRVDAHSGQRTDATLVVAPATPPPQQQRLYAGSSDANLFMLLGAFVQGFVCAGSDHRQHALDTQVADPYPTPAELRSALEETRAAVGEYRTALTEIRRQRLAVVAPDDGKEAAQPAPTAESMQRLHGLFQVLQRAQTAQAPAEACHHRRCSFRRIRRRAPAAAVRKPRNTRPISKPVQSVVVSPVDTSAVRTGCCRGSRSGPRPVLGGSVELPAPSSDGNTPLSVRSPLRAPSYGLAASAAWASSPAPSSR